MRIVLESFFDGRQKTRHFLWVGPQGMKTYCGRSVARPEEVRTHNLQLSSPELPSRFKSVCCGGCVASVEVELREVAYYGPVPA